MKTYAFAKDLKTARAFFDLSQTQMAAALKVSRITLSRYENGHEFPSAKMLEAFYTYCLEHRPDALDFNVMKARFYQDKKGKKILLFHGAKNVIEGPIDAEHGSGPNDFGSAFYAGETLAQAASWVAAIPGSSVYCLTFEPAHLRYLELDVDETWMLAILYYRGKLGAYARHPKIVALIQKIESYDYLIAPIADNQMYQTLDDFARKEITDEQCAHALSATQLGKQYVFRNRASCHQVRLIDRLYLTDHERADYLKVRQSADQEGLMKAKYAKIEYRRKGKFIDELFAE